MAYPLRLSKGGPLSALAAGCATYPHDGQLSQNGQLFNFFVPPNSPPQPIPFNQLPGVDPLSQTLLQYYPLANSGPFTYVDTQMFTGNSDQFGVRVDHYLTARDTLDLRYSCPSKTRITPARVVRCRIPSARLHTRRLPRSVSLPNFADPFNGQNPFNGAFAQPMTLLVVSPNLRLPYAQDWNLNAQRAFGSDWLLEVGYIGTKSTKLARFIEANPAVYIPGESIQDNADQPRLYSGCTVTGITPCTYSSVGEMARIADSSYNARHRLVLAFCATTRQSS